MYRLVSFLEIVKLKNILNFRVAQFDSDWKNCTKVCKIPYHYDGPGSVHLKVRTRAFGDDAYQAIWVVYNNQAMAHFGTKGVFGEKYIVSVNIRIVPLKHMIGFNLIQIGFRNNNFHFPQKPSKLTALCRLEKSVR